MVPGTRVAVVYFDVDVGHERILVWPVSPVQWFVVPLDDDCWVED